MRENAQQDEHRQAFKQRFIDLRGMPRARHMGKVYRPRHVATLALHLHIYEFGDAPEEQAERHGRRRQIH